MRCGRRRAARRAQAEPGLRRPVPDQRAVYAWHRVAIRVLSAHPRNLATGLFICAALIPQLECAKHVLLASCILIDILRFFR